MADISPDEFVCPGCKERALTCNPFIIHRSAYRLELCYFVCINCGTCGYSKQLIRQIISRWRRHAATNVPFEQLCREVYVHLDGMMDHRVGTMGYRRATFRRKNI
jgi:hypothetical protein